MRGALKPFEVKITELKRGETKFKLSFDPAKADLKKMLAAMAKVGEKAKQLN